MSFSPEFIDKARMFVLACQRAHMSNWRHMLAARFRLTIEQAGDLLIAMEKPSQ